MKDVQSFCGMTAALMTVVLAVGCTDKTPPLAVPGHAYAVVDTIPSVTGSGATGVLKRDGVVIDTVDIAFGAPVVGRDSVLFLAVTSARDSSGRIVHVPAAHVLFDGTSRVPVASIAPDFDETNSAPAVIDGALLYWGLRRSAGRDSVLAVRYEFKRRRLNPLPTAAMLPPNAPRFYFTPPYLEGKEIVFKAPTGEWRFRTPKQ